MSGYSTTLRVLQVEDNDADTIIIREALGTAFTEVEMTIHKDGAMMLHWIDLVDAGDAPAPHVILVDLEVPLVRGEEVLRRLQSSPVCKEIPVVVVSASGSHSDRDTAYRLGAVSYFKKPSDFDEFMSLGNLVKGVICHRARGAVGLE